MTPESSREKAGKEAERIALIASQVHGQSDTISMTVYGEVLHSLLCTDIDAWNACLDECHKSLSKYLDITTGQSVEIGNLLEKLRK